LSLNPLCCRRGKRKTSSTVTVCATRRDLDAQQAGATRAAAFSAGRRARAGCSRCRARPCHKRCMRTGGYSGFPCHRPPPALPRRWRKRKKLTAQRGRCAGRHDCHAGQGVRFMPSFDHRDHGEADFPRWCTCQAGAVCCARRRRPRIPAPGPALAHQLRWPASPDVTCGHPARHWSPRRRACQQPPGMPDMVISASRRRHRPAMARAVQSRITPALFRRLQRLQEAGGLAYNITATIAQAPDSVAVLMPASKPRRWMTRSALLPAGLGRTTPLPGCAISCDSIWTTRRQAHACSHDGWFYPGDDGMLDSRVFLYVLGGRYECPHVAGVRINLQAIDNVLAGLPRIDDAGAYTVVRPA